MPAPLNRGSSRETFTSTTGGPSVAAQMGGQVVAFQALGEAGAELQQIGETLLAPEMEAKGAEAVTRDPSGNLQVEMRTPLNRLDVAYNHGATAAYVAQSEGDRRSQFSNLAEANVDDPDKFREGARAWLKSQVTAAPMHLKADLLAEGEKDIGQFTENLRTQKRNRDTRSQLASVNTGIEDTTNDIFALAHQGGTHTPEFAEAVAKLDNQLAQLGNPLFGIGKDQIASRRAEIVSGAEAEATIGLAMAEAQKNGAQAGQDFLDKAIWSPSLSLSPAQRETYANRGRRQINELDATTRAAASQLKQQVEYRLDDAGAAAEATGVWQNVVSPNEIMRAYADNPARGMDIIAKLNGQASIYSARKQLQNATPADIAAMDARLRPGDPTGPQGGFDAFYSGFLAPHEGGYSASDGNGSPVNFGINQGANPDIDVKALTPDQAKNILKDRYWLASGADQLPPDLAAVVGDTAVNMGVQASKDLLAESGGDAKKYLSLREQRYRDIAANDPSKAGNLPTWLKRNADLESYIQGSGYADKVRVYQAFQQAAHERQQALAKDPAGYTLGARGDIAADLGSDDPLKIQRGTRNLLIAERSLGVNAPRILSDGQAKGIVDSFANPPDPEKPADNMIAIIGGLQQRYGTFFPQVMQELRKAGMPGEAIALAQVQNDPAVSWRMARAVNATRNLLRKAVPGAEEMDKSVAEGLAPFNRTLAGQNGNSAAAAQQVQAAQLYAYQLAAEGDSDPAGNAVRDLIGKHYTFSDTYRVPTGTDADDVAAGARILLRDLPVDRIMAESSLDPRLDAKTRQTLSGQVLKGRGVWLTTPDEKGLYLAYPAESGYVPAKTVDGKTITYSWTALTQAGARSTAAIDAQIAKSNAMPE